jgi:hypothetical protein
VHNPIVTTATPIRTFRKSPVAYLGTFLWTCILVFVLSAVASGLSGGGRSFFQLLWVLALIRGIYRLAYLSTVRWVVGPEGLTVARGILPWRKWNRFAPWSTIFEAFYTKSFIGHFLGYGTVTVRRAEGVTSAWKETRMQGSHQLTGTINAALAQHRNLMAPAPMAAPPPAPAAVPAPAPEPMASAAASPTPWAGTDSLSDLARLKANGDITEEEYARLKARIIGF